MPINPTFANWAEVTLDALSTHLAILDPEGTILWVNRAWRDFAGANSGDSRGLNEGPNYLTVCATAQGPDSEGATAFGAGIRAVAEGGMAEFQLEYPCHTPGGQRWFQGRATRFSGPDRQCYLLMAHTDITDRWLAEERLREHELPLRLFVQYTPAAVAMLDLGMNYLVVSQRWLEDYRLPPEPLVGRNHYEVFPDLPDRWRAIHQRCLAGAVEACEADPFPRADGTTDWVRWEIRPWRKAGGAIGGLIIFSEVITARIRAEEVLRRNQAMLARTEAAVQLGSWAWEVDTDTVTWSAELFRILQIDPALGAPPFAQQDRIYPAGEFARLRQAAARAIAEGIPYDLELKVIRPDGEARICAAGGNPEWGADGRVHFLHGWLQDITERKQAEQLHADLEAALRSQAAQLRKAQEDERLRISRTIHDDLGQLTTALKIAMGRLERKLAEPGLPPGGNALIDQVVQATELADAIQSTTQRIAAELRPSLVDQLGLEGAIRQELRQLRERTGLDCEVVAQGPCPDLPAASRGELFYLCREALTNVLRHARATRVEVGWRQEGGTAVFTVSDDGIGMTARNELASPSVGLTGMRERAALCGGTLAFEPNPPHGTRITARLPLPGPAAEGSVDRCPGS